jgi:O-antigen/teichoic acid export membrane protein
VVAGVESEPAAPAPSLARLDATPTLARQTLTYAVSGVIGPAIAVFTLPVFARIFTQSQYGILELATTLTTLALTITDLGLIAAAQRSFYDHGGEDDQGRHRVLVTAFVTTTGLSFVVALTFVLFRDQLSSWLFGRDVATVLAIVAISLLPLNAFRFITETMRLRFQALHYLVTSAIATVVTSVLALGAVVVLDLGVEGVFAASVVGSTAACAYGLLVVRPALAGRFSRPELRTMLAFGLPLVPTTLAAWLLALVDRLLLAKLGDLDEVGQFAIAARLTILLQLAVNAFMLAIGPFLYSLYAEQPALEKAARGRLLTYLTFILGLGALLVTLFAHEVLSVLAPRFLDAQWAVGPLAFGLVAYGLAALLTTGFSLARRTMHLASLSLVAAAVNVTLNLTLIPPFGFVGAAFATASGYLVLAATYYLLSQRVYPTPYEPRRVLTILVLAASLAAVGVLPIDSVLVALAAKVAALGVFFLALSITRAMTRAEWTELRRFLKGMVAPGHSPGPEPGAPGPAV